MKIPLTFYKNAELFFKNVSLRAGKREISAGFIQL
jgi:hypothetical protein